MSVKVKICGITNATDANAAVKSGADVLGFVFCPKSPRCVALDVAAGIIRALPPFVVKAGVFVDAKENFVERAVNACGLNLLQFHGHESPDYCLQFGVMSIKAFRIRDAGFLDEIPSYKTDAWLLDAWSPARTGGTGEAFNWDLAIRANQFGRPIFLAGGLTPENVGEAIRKVRPYAVDVSSGVESAPGKKDHRKLKAFLDAAKSA